MLQPVRLVPPVEKPRCPQCHCFVRLDAGTCTACGSVFALATETRSTKAPALDKTLHLVQGVEVESVGFQSGPKGNASIPPSFQFRNSDYSNLQPDGKIKKRKITKQLDQLNLFDGGL